MTARKTSEYLSSQERDLLCFTLDNNRYAIRVGSVREIINPTPCIQLPQAPASILGVADHRNQIVSVLSLRHRYGLPELESTHRAKWIIVEHKDKLVALVVDNVVDVLSSTALEARGIPDIGSSELLRSISSAYMVQETLVFVLNMEEIVRPVSIFEYGSGVDEVEA